MASDAEECSGGWGESAYCAVLSRVIAIGPDFDRLTKVAAIESQLLATARALPLTPASTTFKSLRLFCLQSKQERRSRNKRFSFVRFLKLTFVWGLTWLP